MDNLLFVQLTLFTLWTFTFLIGLYLAFRKERKQVASVSRNWPESYDTVPAKDIIGPLTHDGFIKLASYGISTEELFRICKERGFAKKETTMGKALPPVPIIVKKDNESWQSKSLPESSSCTITATETHVAKYKIGDYLRLLGGHIVKVISIINDNYILLGQSGSLPYSIAAIDDSRVDIALPRKGEAWRNKFGLSNYFFSLDHDDDPPHLWADWEPINFGRG